MGKTEILSLTNARINYLKELVTILEQRINKAPEGKIKISVYSIENTACIRVEDNGIGMSEETIQNLMSGKPAEKDDKKSSAGIGMDNVMARLKLFVGSDDVMSIESEGEGKGSKFTIYLDMKEA